MPHCLKYYRALAVNDLVPGLVHAVLGDYKGHVPWILKTNST